MAEPVADNTALRGRQVAITGRLAAMTHAEAAALVRARGGEFSPHVTQKTALLVVGREGWPLREDGRLSRALLRARELRSRGAPLSVVTEDELYGWLGLASRVGGGGLYDIAQLGQILGVSRDRIRAWLRAGLIEPAKTEAGVAYFDFRRVSGAKMLSGLTEAGISPARIRQSLEQLRTWTPDVDEPLRQLAAIEGKLLLRLAPDQLAEPTGQLRLDFDAPGDGEGSEDSGATGGLPASADGKGATVGLSAGAAASNITPVRTGDEWFALGCAREDAGRPAEAVAAYRESMLTGGPNADGCYNLANALYALGRKQQAAERLWQAVELDPEFADAWNNLGNILSELGDTEDAVKALGKAVDLEPAYGDAHYNLADVLDSMGRTAEARPHWEAYLRESPEGPWAEYARTRLTAAENAS